MAIRTKILFLSSVAFLCFFVFGITESGQSLFAAHPPPNASASAAGDIAMNAGLTPMVYGLIPFLLLLISALVSWFFDRRGKSD